MDIAAQVLEDKSTLLTVPLLKDSVLAPKATLVTMFAIQPSVDYESAAKTLFRVTDQPGVQLIRSVFSVTPRRDTRSPPRHYLALYMAVRVSYEFMVWAKPMFPGFLQEARQAFAQRRNVTLSILEGTGCRVTLIEGKELEQAYLFHKRVKAGITVFKDHKGFQSKFIEPFLRLDRVPSRYLPDYKAPTLPVVHHLGTRLTNTAQGVGFPHLPDGVLLIAGSDRKERVSVLQELIGSFIKHGSYQHLFILDTKRQLNGLAKYYETHPATLQDQHFQVLRLGENLHLNLCDVQISAVPTSMAKQKSKAKSALKAYIISQILLSAFGTSDYLTDRLAIPLQARLAATTELSSSFTLNDLNLDPGAGISGGDPKNTEAAGLGTMFADMTALEQLTGILEQFRAFQEVNYPSFLPHFGHSLVSPKTITLFQLGSQPPMVARAVIFFLLHYLAQTMTQGCVVMTDAPDFLAPRQAKGRYDGPIPKFLEETCERFTTQNLLVLGSHSFQQLHQSLDLVAAVKNAVYLHMTHRRDRDLILSHHQLPLPPRTSPSTQQHTLGVYEREGLLFREDAPRNAAYHFSYQPRLPIDLEPYPVGFAKPRGSETLGLTPEMFAVLMQVLKVLVTVKTPRAEALEIIRDGAGVQAERVLKSFLTLGVFEQTFEEGITFWEITAAGRAFYTKQEEYLSRLPSAFPPGERVNVIQELKQLESFYESTDSRADRLETNTNVKVVVGHLLNYLRLLSRRVPWNRVAEYRELEQITGLERQDFVNLFEGAYELANHLVLEVSRLEREQQSTLQPQARESREHPPTLEGFLPAAELVELQRICREVGLPQYPQTGIVDLYYALEERGRNLWEELRLDKISQN